MRAGSLWQKVETSASSPAAAPADILFGLGARTSIDVVRVLWPAGIVQAEPIGADTMKARALDVVELDRKPSSCPYIYTWNGDRFEFVTDFLGGGEMGYQVTPGVYSTPDPEEFVRIRGDQLRARDGRFELRVTNELEETLFLDHLSLVAVDHPAGTDVFPREGLVSAPVPGLRIETLRDRRAPARVVDASGRDASRCRCPHRSRVRRWPAAAAGARLCQAARDDGRPGPIDAGAGRRAAAHRVDRLRLLERQHRGLARRLRAAPALAAGAQRARRMADGDRGDRRARRPPADRGGRPDRPLSLRQPRGAHRDDHARLLGPGRGRDRATAASRRRRPASPRRSPTCAGGASPRRPRRRNR